MQKLIITGGSGLLALNWALSRRNECKITLFTNTRTVKMPKVSSIKVDLLKEKDIREHVIRLEPDVIVHTAGLTNVDKCEEFPELAHICNVEIAEKVAKVAGELNIKLVHMSTDHLFSGKTIFADEKTTPSPLNVYAKTKLEAEHALMRYSPSTLIIRSNFFGWGHKYRESLTDWIIRILRSGHRLPGFVDAYFTPMHIEFLVRNITKLINLKQEGVFNVVGDERVSKYEFAVAVAEKFELRKELIFSDSLLTFGKKALRPLDLSLSNQKINSLLKESPTMLKNSLDMLYEQNETGYIHHIEKAVQV